MVDGPVEQQTEHTGLGFRAGSIPQRLQPAPHPVLFAPARAQWAGTIYSNVTGRVRDGASRTLVRAGSGRELVIRSPVSSNTEAPECLVAPLVKATVATRPCLGRCPSAGVD